MTLPTCHTVDEIAAALKKSPASIRRLIHAGKLKAYRIGPELRITEEQLNEYLRENLSVGPVACRNPRSLRSRRIE